jgi:hypothetical protein
MKRNDKRDGTMMVTFSTHEKKTKDQAKKEHNTESSPLVKVNAEWAKRHGIEVDNKPHQEYCEAYSINRRNPFSVRLFSMLQELKSRIRSGENPKALSRASTCLKLISNWVFHATILCDYIDKKVNADVVGAYMIEVGYSSTFHSLVKALECIRPYTDACIDDIGGTIALMNQRVLDYTMDFFKNHPHVNVQPSRN